MGQLQMQHPICIYCIFRIMRGQNNNIRSEMRYWGGGRGRMSFYIDFCLHDRIIKEMGNT